MRVAQGGEVGTTKLTMPIAWTTGMVAWGMLDFEEGYKKVRAPPPAPPATCSPAPARHVRSAWTKVLTAPFILPLDAHSSSLGKCGGGPRSAHLPWIVVCDLGKQGFTAATALFVSEAPGGPGRTGGRVHGGAEVSAVEQRVPVEDADRVSRQAFHYKSHLAGAGCQ